MSQRNELEYLLSLPASEIEHRTAGALDRIETRSQRCTDERRDLTEREAELTRADTEELTALRQAAACQEQIEARGRAVDEAIELHRRGVEARSRPTLLVSRQNLRDHAAALAEGRGFGAVEGVEMRSRVTAAADLGSAGGWNSGAPNEPRHLLSFSGVPVSPLTGRTAQVPAYTGPTAAAGVDESTDHGEYDSIAPVNLTALRYGRWSDVSALANQVDELTGLNVMHATGIARDLDRLAVQAIEGVAGSLGVSVDIPAHVREAVLYVAATTYSAETDLVIVGQPADLAELTGTTPTNADDLGSYAVRFAGARLYATTAASANLITVFWPGGFRVFQSSLQSASQIDPASGAHKFGSWLHSTGVAEQIVGSAVMVGAS
ncbi:hypothetical protein MHPYR_890001 [uncultured Mycobacterium sp.]|uniref:Phage major capsid protein n=1 Tax=uncultured Mycobacterium sp. TaxID=171292 RepID=A0A1Y5PUR1_9MYCO|nr:hypothetical protein MHPYR_890001 [uncultured Mycobacterium sp.]